MTNRWLFAMVASAGLSGCAAFTPNQVAQPGSITFDQALQDVVVAYKNSGVAEGSTRMGVWICTVTINFNVAASASQGGKLLLDATIKAPAPVNAGLSASAEQDFGSNANRGNTISMTLANPMCIPNATTGGAVAGHLGAPLPSGSNGAGEAARAGVGAPGAGGGAAKGSGSGGVYLTPQQFDHWFPPASERIQQ